MFLFRHVRSFFAWLTAPTPEEPTDDEIEARLTERTKRLHSQIEEAFRKQREVAAEPPAPVDLRTIAEQKGLIVKGQFVGLGSVHLRAHEGTYEDQQVDRVVTRILAEVYRTIVAESLPKPEILCQEGFTDTEDPFADEPADPTDSDKPANKPPLRIVLHRPVRSAAQTYGMLMDNMNRDCWITQIILGGDLEHVDVTGISIAGIPINMGMKGAPAQAFARDSAAFNLGWSRRLVRAGQSVAITLVYTGNTEARVNACLVCDEMATYLVQAAAEADLQAAISGGFRYTVPGKPAPLTEEQLKAAEAILKEMHGEYPPQPQSWPAPSAAVRDLHPPQPRRMEPEYTPEDGSTEGASGTEDPMTRMSFSGVVITGDKS